MKSAKEKETITLSTRTLPRLIYGILKQQNLEILKLATLLLLPTITARITSQKVRNLFDSIDYSKAAEWFKKCFYTPNLASSLLNVYISSAFQLGIINMQGGAGLGDPNPIEALDFFKLAAVRGHPDSIFNVGVFTLNGYGTEVNITAGLEMILIAIEANPSLKMPPPLRGLSEGEVIRFAEVCKSVEVREGESPKDFMDRMVILVKLESKAREVKVKAEAKAEIVQEGEDGESYFVYGVSVVVLVLVIGVGYMLRK
jgi:TPR repeat protein